MQFDTKKTVEHIMVMTPDEAHWLNGVMQNPLHGQSPTEETPVDRHMRELFFNATKAAQIR